MITTRPTPADYEAKRIRLEAETVAVVRKHTKNQLWDCAFSTANIYGDMAGVLKKTIAGMNVHFRSLARDVLGDADFLTPPSEKPDPIPQRPDLIQHLVFSLLDSDDPLSIFCTTGDLLITLPSEDTTANLDKMPDWMLQWGVKYMERKIGLIWEEADEDRMWRMITLVTAKEAGSPQYSVGLWKTFNGAFGTRSLRRKDGRGLPTNNH